MCNNLENYIYLYCIYMAGAGKLVLTTGKHPGQLKDEVCSSGGMSIVGVQKLENSSIRYLTCMIVIIRGVLLNWFHNHTLLKTLILTKIN